MGKLGDKKGYVVFDGKSYRKGQLAQKCQDDPAMYEALLGLFYDEVTERAA